MAEDRAVHTIVVTMLGGSGGAETNALIRELAERMALSGISVSDLGVWSGFTTSQVGVVDAGGDTTCWPLLGTSQVGNMAPATDAGLTYNANTNALTASTFVGALTGNASSATKLATARAINGVDFDGTAPITVPAVDATARAGGIAIASQAALDFIFASSSGQLGRIAAGTALQVPRINAAGNGWEFSSGFDIAPTWTGAHIFKKATDSATGWQIQDQDGNVIVVVDSANNVVGIGTAPLPVIGLHVKNAALVTAQIATTDAVNSYGLKITAGGSAAGHYAFRVLDPADTVIWLSVQSDTGNVWMAATKKFYLDGGSDTYIYESSANVLDVYVGAANVLKLATAGAALPVIPAFAASDKYLVVDASGNIHKSALGPAS